MKLIEFVRTNGDTVWINPQYIVAVDPDEEHRWSTIVMAGPATSVEYRVVGDAIETLRTNGEVSHATQTA